MLLVVQKEVDDDGTWLKPDDTRKWFNRTFSLSMRRNRGRETLERRKALWRERHYRKMADSFTDTHTLREVWENDLVFKGTCFLIWRSLLSEVTLAVCLWGDATISVPVTLLFLTLFLFLSGTTISLFIFIYALHCWSRSKICVSLLQLCTERVL